MFVSMDRIPSNVVVNAACFMMDLRDLPGMFGEIVRPAVCRAPLRDLDYFHEWLQVISDPFVVKVYIGITSEERQYGKRMICQELHRRHRLTLTVNGDPLVLSKSQVIVPLKAMVAALTYCGHKECRVESYGMRWDYKEAQPEIDRFVRLHTAPYGTLAVTERNRFDISIKVPATAVDIFRFRERQVSPFPVYRQGRVHDMFNVEGFGAIDFTVPDVEGISHIKIYQELAHAVLSEIPKSCLDDMPRTVQTLRTRAEQLKELLQDWDEDAELPEKILGTRIEITVVGVNSVREAVKICLDLDLLTIQGIERRLIGPLQVRSIPIQEVLEAARSKVRALEEQVRGGNEDKPSIRMRTALTEARQAFGWSGEHMPGHLVEARKWVRLVAAVGDRDEREVPRFEYDCWEQDPEDVRPVIQDFLDNAHWQNHGRSHRNPDPCPIFLQRTRGGGYFKVHGVYFDRVSGARHFVNKHGIHWRRWVKPKPVPEDVPLA